MTRKKPSTNLIPIRDWLLYIAIAALLITVGLNLVHNAIH